MNTFKIIPMNLQFFAEGDNDGHTDNTGDSGTDNMVDNQSTDNDIDVKALAEIISDKDKKLDDLTSEVNKLKKTNAELLVRISAGEQKSVSIDESILGLDTRKRS